MKLKNKTVGRNPAVLSHSAATVSIEFGDYSTHFHPAGLCETIFGAAC